ncbi:MAG: tetratricopeptide repeat protein [Gammaproteobacteria bacterium]
MPSELTGFGEIASHLDNPMVLIGLALLLVFGVRRALILSGVLPPVDRKTSGIISQSLLRYGSWIAVLLIVLGIASGAYQTQRETQPAIVNAETASKAIKVLTKQLQTKRLQAQERQDQIEALTETVQALARKQDAPGVKEALAALAQGQTEAAKAIFAKAVEAKAVEGAAANREAAEAARHLGALAVLDDTEEALRWYRRAVELDPANADGWNQLGHLYHWTGPLDQAEAAFRKVVTLGEANADMEAIAAGTGNLRLIYRTRGELDRAEEMYKKALAIEEKLGRQEGMARNYRNLGIIYRKRGELDRAEEMHKKALAIEEKLGRQEGMAADYGNLGLIYRTRGELDRAEEMYTKALAIEEKLGRQEGMANQYGNLGILYQTRGELDRAEEMYTKALVLFKETGAAPRVKQVQTWLDTLNKSSRKR